MPVTYIPIASQTLTSSAASVTFSSIPQTYTDLVLRITARYNNSPGYPYDNLGLQINGITTGYSQTLLSGNGSTAGSNRQINGNHIYGFDVPTGNGTASTFGSMEFYLPNYRVSANKVISNQGVGERNAIDSRLGFIAGLWSNTAAITSLTLLPFTGAFDVGSSFHLIGISNT